MEEKIKTTTEQWFECPTCHKKMTTMTIGSSSGFDIFGIGGKGQALYCNNKECEKFGYLTVVGIRKEE